MFRSAAFIGKTASDLCKAERRMNETFSALCGAAFQCELALRDGRCVAGAPRRAAALRSRRAAIEFSIAAREMRDRGEAGGNRDLGHAQCRVLEQMARALQPRLQEILRRRHAEMAAEQPLQLALTDAGLCGDAIEVLAFGHA